LLFFQILSALKKKIGITLMTKQDSDVILFCNLNNPGNLKKQNGRYAAASHEG